MNIFLWSNTERWKFQEKIIEVYYFLIQNAIYLKVSDFSYITNNLLIVYLSIKRTLKNYNKKSVTTLCIMLIIKPISKCSKCLAISGVRLQNIFKLRNFINHTFHNLEEILINLWKKLWKPGENLPNLWPPYVCNTMYNNLYNLVKVFQGKLLLFLI